MHIAEHTLERTSGSLSLAAAAQRDRSTAGGVVIETPLVRRFSAEEWRVYRDLRLRALADSPDAFGSTLAEEADRLDAEWARRLASGVESETNLPILAEAQGEAIGLAWSRIDTSNLDVAFLYQMWVAPTHRRLGAGRMLLRAVIEW